MIEKERRGSYEKNSIHGFSGSFLDGMFAANGNASAGRGDGYRYATGAVRPIWGWRERRSEARTIRNRRKPGLCD